MKTPRCQKCLSPLGVKGSWSDAPNGEALLDSPRWFCPTGCRVGWIALTPDAAITSSGPHPETTGAS